jgi:predicted DNA-binding antitoxin AbrB/MazE fold protein
MGAEGIMTEVFEGTYRSGVFVPSTPVGIPEGTKVEIRVAPEPAPRMMREEDWPTTPEGIEAHIKRMESFEPCVFSADEEADLAAWRAKVKQFNVEAVRKQMGLDK